MSGAPTIPTDLQIYNSYVEDPKWQRKFTIIWTSLTGLAVLAAGPHLFNSIKRRRAFKGFFGISEDFQRKCYTCVVSEEHTSHGNQRQRQSLKSLRLLGSLLLWSLPGLRLNLGQMLIMLGYLIIVLVCIICNANLMDNPNRAGFLVLAQLPVVFLFATKNSLLSILLGPGNGYEKLNFIHRWSGRCMFLAGAVHGALWIRNHLEFGLSVIGPQKETSGVAAFGILCVIVLSSLQPIRRYFYQVFFIIHVIAFVAFLVTIRYHTRFASPWIFPPLALYGADLLLRMFRFRIKDATLIRIDNQMTIIHIPDCDDGWLAGQHVRLRILFSGRIFESHPLTIMTAPPPISCLSAPNLVLGARVCGDWSRALNLYALEKTGYLQEEKAAATRNVPVQVMIDGPYGGCSIDIGDHESVLLVAGGSGATFTLGLLDDIVGRCIKLGRKGGERTRKIEFAWCVRSFGSIQWFAPIINDIATMAAGTTLDLHISIFVTCLCDPEAVPLIPNSEIVLVKPSVLTLLDDLATDSWNDPSVDEASASSNPEAPRSLGGGVAVCASGPEALIREVQSAVVRLELRNGTEYDRIALHTELFVL